eukprot:6343848-Amphidinium_carterae.1
MSLFRSFQRELVELVWTLSKAIQAPQTISTTMNAINDTFLMESRAKQLAAAETITLRRVIFAWDMGGSPAVT